jgi:hypothetical protein
MIILLTNIQMYRDKTKYVHFRLKHTKSYNNLFATDSFTKTHISQSHLVMVA